MTRKTKQPARRSPAKKAPIKTARAVTPRRAPARNLDGWITHTNLSSNDPAATREWCAKVLGWKFQPTMSSPRSGSIDLFSYSEMGGGGIVRTQPSEAPGSVPFAHVANAQAAFDAALEAGAEALQPPVRVMEGVRVAVVRAPGGVTIGFSGR